MLIGILNNILTKITTAQTSFLARLSISCLKGSEPLIDHQEEDSSLFGSINALDLPISEVTQCATMSQQADGKDSKNKGNAALNSGGLLPNCHNKLG